jgi:hypothetical protein
MVLHLHTRSQEHTPARSVALITAEMSEAFLLAGNRALEAAPMVGVDSMVAVDSTAVEVATAVEDIGNRMYPCMEFAENSRME